jgi:hypothetical protein
LAREVIVKGPYGEVLPGRNLEMYKETIKDRKNISGGFHYPHFEIALREMVDKQRQIFKEIN